MQKAIRLGLVALFIGGVASTPVFACHSQYFNEMFVKIKRLKSSKSLQHHQVAEIWKLCEQFQKTERLYGRQGKPSSALTPHVNRFVAAAAGILDTEQFRHVTGKQKTEIQELRYEVNQLKREIREIKELLGQLQKPAK